MVAPANAAHVPVLHGGITTPRRHSRIVPPRTSSAPSLCLTTAAVSRYCPTLGVTPASLSALRSPARRLAARGGARGGVQCSADVPDYLPASWARGTDRKPLGPRLEWSAEEAVRQQLCALQSNDDPYPDHGVEVMYRFAGFDPFERSRYFGPRFDLGQFERFRRLFHHTHYRVLLSHKRHRLLSSFYVSPARVKQRVEVEGVRPGEVEVFEFTLEQ
ncbi:unnamed protein product, partial [Closterium sp. NIES-64]